MVETVIKGYSCQRGMEEHRRYGTEIAVPFLPPFLNLLHQRKKFSVSNNFLKYKMYYNIRAKVIVI